MRKLGFAVPCALAVALVATASAAAFTPTNAYYPKQWYLEQDRAFDAWPAAPPALHPVKVAIIDSGVECSLPDFNGQIAAAKSFVGGNACLDAQGHGTIVAGEIAGGLGAGGIVGLAYSSQLLVAKVVAPDGTIPLKAEAAAIRWAVDQGARVVNLSFGAVRDPLDPSLDSFSRVEAKAVAYAVKRGALVVAAVGNADEAYATPWEYASWPAALPHVLGVGALSRSGDVPDFSDRDPTFVDIAAPGVGIFSTFPKALTSSQAGCTPQGTTDCATGDYHHPEGTSFAAPQVSAAAAVLFGLLPTLTSDQVSAILERQADDVNAATGCGECPVNRDKYSGWGRLDVTRAVNAIMQSGSIPPADRFEPNDRISQAHTLKGRTPNVTATLDYWDDSLDAYSVKLARGQRLVVAARSGAAVRLAVLRGAKAKVAETAGPGQRQRLAYRASRTGWYYIELRMVGHAAGSYTLGLTKSS